MWYQAPSPSSWYIVPSPGGPFLLNISLLLFVGPVDKFEQLEIITFKSEILAHCVPFFLKGYKKG